MELSDLEHIQEAGLTAEAERRDLVMQLAQQEGSFCQMCSHSRQTSSRGHFLA